MTDELIAIVYVTGRRYKMPYTVEGRYGGWNARCAVLDMQRHGATREGAVATLRVAVQDYLRGGYNRQQNLNPLELIMDDGRAL